VSRRSFWAIFGLEFDEEMTRHGFLILFSLLLSPLVLSAADIVAFPSGDITLHGVLYKPEGPEPFPAVVYNHGSAAGMVSKSAFDALGPVFASHGWVFLGPYRRGQGLSASAGPYIGDQIDAAEKKGGISAGARAHWSVSVTHRFLRRG
jgi:carboxymethylenebutenolidase